MRLESQHISGLFLGVGLAALAVATIIVVHPPAWFGARTDFLIYQRAGLAPGTVFRFVFGIAVSSLALAAYLAGRRIPWTSDVASRTYWSVLVAVPVAVLLGISTTVPWAVCAGADASGYLEFHPFRTIGYPIFLMGVAGVFGDFAALYPVQLGFLLGSMGVLAHAIGRLADDRRLAIVVLVPMSSDVSLIAYVGSIAPEAPFAALICLHLAAVFLALRRVDAKLCAVAGIMLGLAILMRPAGYAFLAAAPALLLLLPACRARCFLAFALCVAAPLIAASVTSAARGGSFATQSFGGIAMFGMVAHLVDADMPSATPALVAEIAARTAPDAERLRALRVPHEQWRATMNAYNDILWRRAYPAIEAWIDAELPEASAYARRAAAAKLAGALTLEAIRYDPLGFAKQFVSHFYGMWLLSFLPHGPFAERVAICGDPYLESLVVPRLDPARRAAADARRDTLMPLDFFWAAATLLQFPAIAIAVLTTFASPFLLFSGCKQSPVVGGLAYAGLGAGAYVCMFAIAQVALPRYAVVMEPWLICLVGLAIVAAFRRRGGERKCAA
jgi:hypothetical protein